MFFQKIRKLTIGFILSVFIFSSVVGFIFSVQSVNAQATVAVAADVPAQAESIFDVITNALKIAVLNAAQQSVSYFLRKIAYDSAVWVASGGKGQKPFFEGKGFGDYMKSVASETAGTAIEQLGKGFGMDLCKMPDVKLDLAFRIGLHHNYSLAAAGGAGPAKPACDLDKFSKGWDGDAWRSKYGNGNGNDFSPGKVFSSSLKVDDSPLGVAMKTTEKIDRLVAVQTMAAESDRKEGGGFNAAKKLISNDIKIPSQVVAQEAKANAPSEQNKKSEAQINAAMGAGAYQIIPSTLALFLNTLAGQMLTNFKENGMLPGGVCVGSYGGAHCKSGSGSKAQNFDSAPSISGRSVAEAAFNEFLVAKLETPSDYDFLAQFNSCESKGLYNCRADDKLIQAIQQAKEEPMTIREALDKGWLRAEWKLIPPSRNFDNAIENKCFNTAYCYSNIQVLRQLGIMPLGLEIAAKNSDPDSPWTLKEVVDGFYNCNYEKTSDGKPTGQINYDPENKPFCHLVDPNWVIKLPQTRCDVSSFGSMPLSMGVPNRLKECVDVKTCVGQDEKGNCLGYGNCLRERNIWKFKADSCKSEFATCRSFVDNSGKAVSYLYRTLDTGDCSQDTAGCTAYSLEQNDAGKWQSVAPTEYGNYSTGIYLNKNVSTACSADSIGCSAFKLASGANTDRVHLKKAPDYLHCYDADAKQDNGTQWPKTFSDIFKMKPRPECANYAQVCIADEVGCSTYTSAIDVGATPIPGKFTPVTTENGAIVNWNDQCNEKCVGYGTYREMPSNYAAGTPLAYIIPPSKHNNQSGATCKKEEVSCSSFTNMAQDGGEKVEYFTDLRVCIKPDPTKQKNYYTYEGSITGGGYQLKSYILEKDSTTGAPKTVFLTEQDKIDTDTNKCNATLYKAGNPDPDCRQFNDDKGAIYYAMLSHTVVVSADCTPYRLNSSELAVSDPGKEQCFGNGEYKEGSCFYDGLPTGVITYTESSKTCTAPAVSCREYKGNNGNNIQTLLTENFENTDSATVVKGWSSTGGTIAWTAESTHVVGHSLGYSGAADSALKKTVDLKYDSFDAQSNISYSLSFWAKGSGVNVDIAMTDEKNNSAVAGTITANTSWQYFTFNLLELQSAGTSTINFKLEKVGNLFLDNVRLTKVSEYLYLVKDSLKVDPICDDNQTDNLPGVALGCSAYIGPPNSVGNKDYFLTNFSFLCREGAIGCTAFIDTFNKKDGKNNEKSASQAYNVSLSGQTGTKATIQIDDRSFSCQIEQGKTSCYLKDPIPPYTKKEIEDAGGKFVTSTYFIPTDSTSSIYLVADASASASCSAANIGCTIAGLQKSTPSGIQFETTTIKLDPAQLLSGTDVSDNPSPGILCHEQALGCGAYDSSLGETYFKDPAAIGAKVCAYNPNITINNNKVSGWFWKGVGACGNTSTQKVASPYATCVNDNDCSANNGCINPDQQPCYPNYLQNGNSYGLWSYGNKDKYNNFVGECQADQNTCTEFVDHNDVDHNDSDKAYYFLNNNKLSPGNCDGMVSQKAGCVLFDQTDNPNKTWNTKATYLLSNDYILEKGSDPSKVTKVPPVDKGASNDANKIIKVTRDRECAQWLQCAQSNSVWDNQLHKWKQSCERVDRCDRLPANAQEDNKNNCANFIGGQHADSDELLTEARYVNRDITWKGNDYDGLSILGMYPVEELGQFDISADNSGLPDWRLGKPIVCGGGTNCPAKTLSDYSCVTSTDPCGQNNEGICLNGICISDPFGNKDKELIKEKAQKYICRAYPDMDSPFPNLLSNTDQDFSGVNRCFDSETGDTQKELAYKCDCNYSKLVFGTGMATKYLSYDSKKLLVSDLSVCIGGSKNGQFCAVGDADLATTTNCPNGTCQIRNKMTKFLGWFGQCLEEDLSRTINGQKGEHPCLSWLPVDKLNGTIDISSQNPKAGFSPPNDSEYCLSGVVYKMPKNFGLCIWDDYYDGNNYPDCNELRCQKVGEQYCKQFQGYRLRAPYNGNVTDKKYIAYLDSYSGVVGVDQVLPDDGADENRCGFKASNGKDCSEALPDDCAIECVLDPDAKPANLLAYNQWTENNIPFYSEQKVGCQITAKIDVQAIAWTDNIWLGKKDSKGSLVGLVVEDSKKTAGFGDKINFTHSSPMAPFARFGTIFPSGLIELMYCNTSPMSMPLSDGSCLKPAEGKPINSEGKVIQNLTYGTWSLGSAPVCSTDANCNGGAACEGVVKITDPMLFKCQRFCKQNSDCSPFVYTDESTQKQVSVNLGACQGYLPKNGTQVEKLGTCQTLADNACVDHTYADVKQKCQCAQYDPQTNECVQDKCTQAYEDVSTECQRVSIAGVPKDKAGTCITVSAPGNCNNKSVSNLIGVSCSTNNTCYSQICTSNGCINTLAVSNAKPITILEKIKYAFYEFQQIFAKVELSHFRIFSSSTSKYVAPYTSLTDSDKATFSANLKNDITATGNTLAKPTPPIIHSVGPCNSGTDPKCIENPENNLTVNNKSDGNVYITASPHTATLQFFAYADKNQMPIKQILVDWGDGSEVTKYGGPNSSFLNQRGVVEANECTFNGNMVANGTCSFIPPTTNQWITPVTSSITCNSNYDCKDKLLDICRPEGIAPDFGTILNDTCDPHYFTATKSNYDCQGEIKSNGAKNKSWNPTCNNDPKFPNGCCIFTPSVQVLDNWGWCNGTCGDVNSPGGVGCYKKTEGIENNECNNPTYTNFTPFKYKVLVAPNKILKPIQ